MKFDYSILEWKLHQEMFNQVWAITENVMCPFTNRYYAEHLADEWLQMGKILVIFIIMIIITILIIWKTKITTIIPKILISRILC